VERGVFVERRVLALAPSDVVAPLQRAVDRACGIGLVRAGDLRWGGERRLDVWHRLGVMVQVTPVDEGSEVEVRLRPRWSWFAIVLLGVSGALLLPLLLLMPWLAHNARRLDDLCFAMIQDVWIALDATLHPPLETYRAPPPHVRVDLAADGQSTGEDQGESSASPGPSVRRAP
jgi:hypothetical protein